MQLRKALAERSHMKKGQLNQLPIAAVSIGVFFMIVGLVVLILVGMNGTTEDADASAVLETGIDAVAGFADWGEIFVVVVAAGVVISLIFGYFYFRARGGRS